MKRKTIKQVTYGGKKYIFSEPLVLSIISGNDYEVRSELLGISLWGDTEEEALVEFYSEFDMLYYTSVNLPDEKLSNSYKRLKKIFLQLVKDIV